MNHVKPLTRYASLPLVLVHLLLIIVLAYTMMGMPLLG